MTKTRDAYNQLGKDLEAGLSRAQCVSDNRPRPDWSQAPEWAQWWAVSPERYPHLNARWYESKPYHRAGWWHHLEDENGNPLGRHSAAGYVGIPLGIDWRTLIAKRQ